MPFFILIRNENWLYCFSNSLLNSTIPTSNKPKVYQMLLPDVVSRARPPINILLPRTKHRKSQHEQFISQDEQRKIEKLFSNYPGLAPSPVWGWELSKFMLSGFLRSSSFSPFSVGSTWLEFWCSSMVTASGLNGAWRWRLRWVEASVKIKPVLLLLPFDGSSVWTLSATSI